MTLKLPNVLNSWETTLHSWHQPSQVSLRQPEVPIPLTMETILSNYADVFNDSIGKLEGELHLYTRDDVPPHKTAPREVPLSVKNNVIAEVKDLQE